MNKFIRKVIREHLVGIYETDQVFGEFLCHVFFRRRTHIDEWVSHKTDTLFTTVKTRAKCGRRRRSRCIVCLWPLMSPTPWLTLFLTRRTFDRITSEKDCRQTDLFLRYYESIAWSIFDEMYQNNEVKREYHVLAFDYESIYKDKLGM